MIEDNNENSISPNSLTKDILNLNFSVGGKSLLHCAAEGSELDVVHLLLRLGFDINKATTDDGKTATDFCKNNEILKFLLNNDAKFPTNFSSTFENFENCSGSKGEIFEIAVDRERLHAAISSQNEDEVLKFRKKYPILRMAYIYLDTAPYNQSATTTSLKKALGPDYCLDQNHSESNFKFYAFLFENGFRDDYTEIENLKMSAGLQELISRILLNDLQYFQPSAHIAYLRNKTKIGTVVGTDADYQVLVDKIYKYINDIGGEEVHDILKILEHSQSLTIVIDFHSKYVNPMCPIMRKETDGITFANDGNIYIGARDKSITLIASTLVHELSHLAFDIVFDNASNPYHVDDSRNENKMLDIVNIVDRDQADCGIDEINSVFSCYHHSLWALELIVRVPELIVLGQRDILDEKFKILFDFYKDHVLTTVQNIIRKPEDFRLKRHVEQLNYDLGHIEEIKCSKGRGIWPNKTQLPSRFQTSNSILCSTPNLLLADIFINLINPSLISSVNIESNKNYFILASVDDFQLLLKEQKILRAWKSSRDVTLILNCENYNEMFQSSFVEQLNKKRKIILFGSNETSLRNISPNIEPVRAQYSWTDIDTKYIEILFKRQICFQSVNVTLESLIDNDCNVITLEKLINDRPIKVETFKVSIDNYDDFQYVERRFTTHRNVETLLSQVSNKNETILLSGVSGCGKSIIFSRICLKIKEKSHDLWVSRINLHVWGETFDSANTLDDPMTFLSNILIQTDDITDRQFQQELFKKLYRKRKVILLFDAYDELNVVYRVAFKQLIQQLSQNIQIWISTRPQFVKGFQNICNKNYVPLELEKFSNDEIYKCASKFWQNFIEITNDKVVELKLIKCARVMLRLFTNSCKAFALSDFFMQPSIIVILAEYYQKHVKEFIFSKSEQFTCSYIDIFDIFKMIVTKKIMTLYGQKGSGIANETAEDFLYQDVIVYLEHLSLQSRFGRSVERNLNYFVNIKYDYFNVVEQTNEFLNGLLQRNGLISIPDSPYSDHPYNYVLDDNVSDYVIANFVLRKLRRITYLDQSINQPEFDAAMKILCINVIHPLQDHLTLIAFIDEGLKHFWSGLSESIFDKLFVYINRTPEITFKFDSDSDFFSYLLGKNAIFLLTLFVNCFLAMIQLQSGQEEMKDNLKEQGSHIDIGPSKFNVEKLKELFNIASNMGVRCIVDLFWQEPDLKALVDEDHLYVKAFRRAFLYFPENVVAVVKDNTTFYQLKNALTKSNEFDNTLRTLFQGNNFQTSTLCVLLNICRNGMGDPLSQEQLNSLIEFEKCHDEDYDYEICEEFFEKYLEMKWFVLKELGYDSVTWKDVITKTLFGTVVGNIFVKFDNILVYKFYKWASRKESLRDGFKDLVVNTIERYFHKCHSATGADQIFQFIRQEMDIDIRSVYRHRDLTEYYEHFITFLPICKEFFTKEEYTSFLTCKITDQDENYFEYILKSKSSEFADVLLTLHHFHMDDAEIIHTVESSCNISVPYSNEILFTIYKTILNVLNDRCVTGRGKLKTNQIISSIQNLFSDPLKKALQLPQRYEHSIFQRACLYEDLYVMNELWDIAKRIGFTDDELKNLLSFTSARARVKKTM